MSKNKILVPFILVTSLFFLWAFLHNLNPILIPHLKKACQLNDKQSSLVDFPIYLAYCLTAIPAGLFMHKYGYKKGIIFGLIMFAFGAILFTFAASERNFLFFLFALFVQGSGAAFLETVANPYMANLGDPAHSEQRLNFAQSFNGLGAMVAPLVGSHFILSGIEHTKPELDAMAANGTLQAYLQSEANTVRPSYFVIAGVVLLVTLLFVFTKIPEIKEPEPGSYDPKLSIDDDGKAAASAHGHAPGTEFSFRVFRISHLKWAIFGIFFYVGSQVGVGSFFIKYSRYVADIPEKTAGTLFFGAMAGFMAGRFLGTFFMRYIKPAKLLSLYATINILLLTVGILAKGHVAVYAVMATPFFMSIMFPTIFALGIKDLGEETKMASSFLIMAIIGGAVAPLAMGAISDATGSIQIAYIVPLICFAYILFFGLKGYKIKPVKS
ncbi:L-fucose:H+ symporter permease [Flavitalea sp. BT771]|uniref:L-fucose:H+ symporter permease n=1 Tax=Flavitalea sp. BT771 TaxID=3063329 RepID=UPI0026E46400|nr:L-fucose:H+ symporter permease [Flavitalea sp. BT771]MDO6429901.1 L-fucose:H+ symporter permease [Flavitalea sp. BT771]MDV6217971.1 L-fucose:H+ symporter permease [Flavitalea sp. BT771]